MPTSSDPIAPRDAEALGITESVSMPVSVELGESYSIILDGLRIEAFLSDNVFVLDPKSPECRTALRGYAYGLGARGKEREAKAILSALGRQG